MIKYVTLISLIFALLFYILIMLIFAERLNSYFTINYIIGYLLMLGNFFIMVKKLVKLGKFKNFFYSSAIRLLILCLLLFLWIKYGKLNIIGLMTGLTSFAIAIPIAAFIYTKFGDNDGTLH